MSLTEKTSSFTIPLLYFAVPINEGNVCKLHQRTTPQHVTTSDNCRSKFMYNITTCSGTCDSTTVASTGEKRYAGHCTCCKPHEYAPPISIPVICQGGKEEIAQLAIITKCRCGDHRCEGVPSHENEVLRNEEGQIVDGAIKKKRRRRALSRLLAIPP